jgi:hypothetical protein
VPALGHVKLDECTSARGLKGEGEQFNLCSSSGVDSLTHFGLARRTNVDMRTSRNVCVELGLAWQASSVCDSWRGVSSIPRRAANS